MTDEPTIVELPSTSATEAAKAKWWRKHHARMSVDELAERTGYSTMEIEWFERGYAAGGRAIGEQEWRRYRLACAGTTVEFFWDRTSQKG